MLKPEITSQYFCSDIFLCFGMDLIRPEGEKKNEKLMGVYEFMINIGGMRVAFDFEGGLFAINPPNQII